MIQFSGDGVVEEREEVAFLLSACGDGSPHSFVITLSFFASRALRDLSVDDTVSNLLFAVIVRGFDVWCEHEAEVVLRQVVRLWLRRIIRGVLHDREPRSKIRGLFCLRRLANQSQKAVTMREHRAMKSFSRHLIAAVPG